MYPMIFLMSIFVIIIVLFYCILFLFAKHDAYIIYSTG